MGSSSTTAGDKERVEPLLPLPIELRIILVNMPDLHLTRYTCRDLTGQEIDLIRGLEDLANVIEFDGFTRVCTPSRPHHSHEHITYIALVPVVQPPPIRMLVPKRYRAIEMPSPRKVTLEHILAFWAICLAVVGALVPAAFPLVAAVALSNMVKELSTKLSELERYFKTIADPLLDIAIMLTVPGVGSTLSYNFLS